MFDIYERAQNYAVRTIDEYNAFIKDLSDRNITRRRGYDYELHYRRYRAAQKLVDFFDIYV